MQDRVRAANPIADVEAALSADNRQALLVEVERRTTRGGDHEQPSIHRMRVITLVAAAVMIGLVGLFVVDRPSVETDAAASPDIDLARAYIDARNSGDETTLRALLAPDSQLTELPTVREQGELSAALDYLRLTEETLTVLSCDLRLDRPQTSICQYEMTNVFTITADVDPIPGSIEVTTDGAQITEVKNVVDTERYVDAMDPWLDLGGTFIPQDFYVWVVTGQDLVPTPRLETLDELEKQLERYRSTGP
jgi:hypothetical protein